jgi:hypothetical protein
MNLLNGVPETRDASGQDGALNQWSRFVGRFGSSAYRQFGRPIEFCRP